MFQQLVVYANAIDEGCIVLLSRIDFCFLAEDTIYIAMRRVRPHWGKARVWERDVWVRVAPACALGRPVVGGVEDCC